MGDTIISAVDWAKFVPANVAQVQDELGRLTRFLCAGRRGGAGPPATGAKRHARAWRGGPVSETRAEGQKMDTYDSESGCGTTVLVKGR
jgi:hypothetical protein